MVLNDGNKVSTMSFDLLYGIGLIWFLVFLVISLVQQLRTFPDDDESEKENKPVDPEKNLQYRS